LTDLPGEIDRLQTCFDLQRAADEIREPETVSQSPEFSSSRKKYYTEKKYLDKFAPEELDALNMSLSHGLAKELGYSVVKTLADR
jgi:hypothetical protein